MIPQCLLISPLRGEEKHPANPLSVSQRFLNFGALSLASYLTNHSIPTVVVDEYTLADGRGLTEELIGLFGQNRPVIVGVSSISSYSAGRTQSILNLLADLWPDVPRVIGGQHFVGYWGENFAKLMPGANALVAGEAESAMRDIVMVLNDHKSFESVQSADLPSNVFWCSSDGVLRGTKRSMTRLPIDKLVKVDYSVYPGSEYLFPSVEFSRGCPFSCVFCANGRENRLGYRRASAASVGEAIVDLVAIRDERPVQFYMQASNFSVTNEEADALRHSLAGNSDIAHWRTEVRVDGVEPGAIKTLAAAGLRVLDLGLESASSGILKLMHKTTDPVFYLSRAEQVLQEATDYGVFTKVNFLIHPGDTKATVMESWEWLKARSNIISGISSGVAMEYPGTPLARDLSYYETEFGTERLPHPLSEWGVHFLRPSSDLGLHEAEAIAARIAQSLQTREDFARAKSFGYLGTDASPEGILAMLPEASHGTPYSS